MNEATCQKYRERTRALGGVWNPIEINCNLLCLDSPSPRLNWDKKGSCKWSETSQKKSQKVKYWQNKIKNTLSWKFMWDIFAEFQAQCCKSLRGLSVTDKLWANMENSKKSIQGNSGSDILIHHSFILLTFLMYVTELQAWKKQFLPSVKLTNRKCLCQWQIRMATMLKTTVTQQVDHVFDGISSLKVQIWWNLNKAYGNVWK